MPYIPSWERSAEKRGMERGEKIGEKRGEKIGKKRGEKIGERRGVQKAKLEIAKRMLNDGLSVELIRKCTLLSEKEIKTLI
jgi:predicted transposase YdaD